MQFPLMRNNFTREDLDTVIEILSDDDPKLTNGKHCEEFEIMWSNWLGCKFSIHQRHHLEFCGRRDRQ